MDIFSALKESGLVTAEQLAVLEREAAESGRSIESLLLEGGVPAADIKQFYAQYYDVPAFTLPEGFTISQQVLDLIPESSSKHYQIMPLRVDNDVLLVGVNNPDDLKMREALNFISTKHNLPYHMQFMLLSEIETAQQFYTNLEGDVGDALETLETELDAEIAASIEGASEDDRESMEHIEEDAPVTKIVATILRYAVDGSASDIHIEPTAKKVGVRFRVDGALATSLELPKNVHMAVVARVKILSAMRLDERRKPQDGRFSATFDDRKIDFRVSVLPTNYGEKVVMRILDTGKGILSLEQSGISPHNMDIITRIVKEPYGIILISGPTGSGKSTTLRGMIQEVDTLTENVMSLEDPIEYNLDGVSQSQVRPEIGYTFANGLRAALRQDPDIIMVGEIRDKETAQLAIQAALTGHLVLSTIHTNNAIGVIPRLVDMGVDPYLIAPTLKMAIAQRLAKTLCEGTGREESIDTGTKNRLAEMHRTLPERYHDRIVSGETMLHPEPTASCSTGYRGRTAITEVLEITPELQDLILKNASEEEFYDSARKHGFMTLQEDAMNKALDHKIPYEEMITFGTQIGADAFIEPDELADVDNQNQTSTEQAIIE
ncbi:MAG TPA: ATPase, T2SS/T4P/T4SS family, partial [Candidatus Paceibacterota bacterium]|nr:ATPase, T2SS/T4P/T4SS family [Candidatus Paceibacterota bacterium]